MQVISSSTFHFPRNNYLMYFTARKLKTFCKIKPIIECERFTYLTHNIFQQYLVHLNEHQLVRENN